jgi:ParB-like chromosome segregation protein Spo0J/DNA modification methylase
MHLLPRSSIIVPPNRQRRTILPGPLKELAESVRTKGLLHPIVVRQRSETEFQLVAGERRLRAIDYLHEDSASPFYCDNILIEDDSIPCTLTSELDELSLREAELEENLLRTDLSWQDRQTAIAELHTMRQDQNGEKQTLKATATEIIATRQAGHPVAVVREITRAQIISRHLDNPAVANARNENEAFQIISRQMEGEFSAALSRKLTNAPSPHTFHLGDLNAILPTLPNGYFDTIIADPPYGIGADDFGDAGSAHLYHDSPELSLALCRVIAEEGFRVAKPQSHAYVFCDIDLFTSLRAMFAAAGWKPFRTPLIWFKGTNIGNTPWPHLGPRRSYELIFYANKGQRPWTKLVPDTITDIPATRTSGGHAAGKPAALYSSLLSCSGTAGDRVLDPCCGSGSIFAAANRLTMQATGIEIDPTFKATIQARMSGKE